MRRGGAWGLSWLLPGLGQLALGWRERGLALLAAGLAAAGLLAWLGEPGLWVTLLPFWVLQALDARHLARGRPGGPGPGWLALAAALPIYLVGWVATEISPRALVTGYPNVQPLVRALFNPDILCRAPTDTELRALVLTPCPAAPAPAGPAAPAGAPALTVRPACADLGARVTVQGTGFPAGAALALAWQTPQGDRRPLGTVRAGAQGRFTATVRVPEDSVPFSVRSRPDMPVQRQTVVAIIPGPPGPLALCPTFVAVLAGLGVTLAVGFLATLVGALLALPLAVLGAGNLMSGRRLSRSVYVLVRMAMNIVRAIEPLILAVVAVVWVGQGPFAGLIALTAHTVAALGKLFSEAIEDVDPGPVEAIRATGATWLQQVAYGVLPQVVPPFVAFTIYRWDINVRMSTVIGFVGGGGIGFLLLQWITLGAWSAAATAILAIAAVVILLDVLSAALRRRIESGRPLVPRGTGPRALLRPLAALLLLFVAVWAWQTARVDLARLARDAPKLRPILGELLRPNLVSYGVVTQTVHTQLTLPCARPPADPLPAAATPTGGAQDLAGPRLALSAACAEAGQVLRASGAGFAPGSAVRLRWQLPDGRSLPVRSTAAVGPDGRFAQPVEVRPLLVREAQAAGRALPLVAEGRLPAGPPRLSEPVRRTVDLLIETLLIALMASSLGALVALPLAFLAAANVVPPTRAGRAVYAVTRTALNLLRAVEPVILAVVFAVWVGFGSPFAGVLALSVVTVASLGKLFSEAVEHVEAGPMEAVWATGATRLQMLWFAVLPQVLLAFLAFGIYHWDINVRMSTVVGLVGGGGIGTQLRVWMNTLQWRNAAVAILGIVLVVSAMDFLSARLRQRLGAPNPGSPQPWRRA
jgi:phosphonate transport system permease protein